ncbi:glycosyltransferase family 39 protein, partial [bacterium]|nr:glycosyltransferase family 39 protein [bacterium]
QKMKDYNPFPRFPIFIFIIALLLRLCMVFFYSSPPTRIDSAEHDILAQNLADGFGFCYYPGIPTSYRPPLYPLYLSLIYRIFGHHYKIAYSFEALIGALTPVIIYMICIQLFSFRVTKLASLITALYPTFIFMSTELMTENLFTFLVALFIYSSNRLKISHSTKFILLTGIILGLATLCRATMLPIIFLIPIWGAFADENPTRGFRNTLLASVIALVVMSPWVIRNYKVHKALVFVDTHGGATFHYHHNLLTKDGYFWKAVEGLKQDEIAKEIIDEKERILGGESVKDVFLKKAARGHLEGLSRIAPERAKELETLSEVERNKAYWYEGWQAVMTYPVTYLRHFLREVIKFWHIFDDEGKFLPVYSFLLPLYFIGVFVSLKELRKFAIFHLLIFNIWIICALINNGTRFRAPFETIIIMIAVNAIFWMYKNIRSRNFVHFILLCDLAITLLFAFEQDKLRFWIKGLFHSLGFDIVPF